jgi:hypothetical protein
MLMTKLSNIWSGLTSYLRRDLATVVTLPVGWVGSSDELTQTEKSTSSPQPKQQKIGLTPLEVQVGGAHYRKGKIQPIEFILDQELGYCEGAVVKYISRHKLKGSGVEDLKKAKHYIDFILWNEYGVSDG